MFRRIILSLSALCALSSCSGGGHVTKDYTPDKTYGHWQTVAPRGNTSGLCYTYSSPLHPVDDRKPYIMVTRRASGKMEVSSSLGFTINKDQYVTLLVGERNFRLRERNGTLWAENEKADAAVLTALSRAKNMKLLVKDTKGKLLTTDFYSTEGLSDALNRVKALCP